MHPEITSFGPFHLKFYGLALTTAFLLGTYISLRRAKRVGVSEDLIVWLSLVVLALAVLGSRFLYVFTHLEEFPDLPAGFFKIWEGGLTMYGGVLVAVAGGIAFLIARGERVWLVCDVVAPALALGEAVTRLGCFMNGCCFGLPTDLPWAVTFPEDSFSAAVFPGDALHPSQLYTFGAALIVFFVVLRLGRSFKYEGGLFWLCILLLSCARFLIDFTRYYGASDYLGRLDGLNFNNNQLITAGLALVSVAAMVALRAGQRKREGGRRSAG
ncbi:MAG: prolipoprotein diacylglyceryl transferase [Candidatus Eisenbacteria bacterium]|nr:prolipoprotein diacylglyceryl transferase [Candidatus Eisenbacteria bacterium]